MVGAAQGGGAAHLSGRARLRSWNSRGKLLCRNPRGRRRSGHEGDPGTLSERRGAGARSRCVCGRAEWCSRLGTPAPARQQSRLDQPARAETSAANNHANKHDAGDGVMMSYGADAVEPTRIAATYIDRLLRGAKISDLPVQFPTKIELVIKLKTAQAIGLDIPATLTARADELI